MLWYDGISERARFFIQWSRAHGSWHCSNCSAVAKGINTGRQKVRSRKGKDIEYHQTIYEHDFDTLHHCAVTIGNRNEMLHQVDCFVLAEIKGKPKMKEALYTKWVAMNDRVVPVYILSDETDIVILSVEGRELERQKLCTPTGLPENYYGSWEEAHSDLVTLNEERLERSQAEVSRALTRLQKVKAMQKPEGV